MRRVAAGDRAAFDALAERLWPEWLRLAAASRTMGRYARSEDDVREIAARLLEKLKKDDFHALRSYPPWHERHPDKGFEDWLRIVATNTMRDFVRERRGASGSDGGGEGEPSVKRLLNEFAESLPLEGLGARPPMTAEQTARQLREFAERRLEPRQLAALGAWLEGASFEEMRDALGLADAAEAKRLVRAAVAVLRREFAPLASGSGA